MMCERCPNIVRTLYQRCKIDGRTLNERFSKRCTYDSRLRKILLLRFKNCTTLLSEVGSNLLQIKTIETLGVYWHSGGEFKKKNISHNNEYQINIVPLKKDIKLFMSSIFMNLGLFNWKIKHQINIGEAAAIKQRIRRTPLNLKMKKPNLIKWLIGGINLIYPIGVLC